MQMAAKTLCTTVLILAAAHGATCGAPKAGAQAAFAAPSLPAIKPCADARCCRTGSGARALPQPARTQRRALGPRRMAAERGDGAPMGKTFVSRKLTDALLDGSVQAPGAPPSHGQPASSAVRPSKRALVRKAATRVISFLFRRPERSQPTGGGAEGPGTAEMWPGASRAPLPASASMPRMQSPESDAQAESARVFDLLNKYSQRHSNGTVGLATTLSDSSDRKPLQKSKYADLYNPESPGQPQGAVRRSKSGKLLQKSKYADVWSAQDQTRPAGSAPRATTKAVTSPVTETKPVSGRPGYYAKPRPSAARQGSAPQDAPPSRLEQLMNRCWPFHPFAGEREENEWHIVFPSVADRWVCILLTRALYARACFCNHAGR